jgi:aspartate kinase
MYHAAMIVQKFGGTSVEDMPALSRLAGIVRGERYRSPVVVVSAMGRTTNRLVEIAGLAVAGDLGGALAGLESISATHAATALEAAPAGEFPDLLDALRDLFGGVASALNDLADCGTLRPDLVDGVLATGERASSRVVAAALRAAGLPGEWVDIRPLMLTGEDFGRAPVIMEAAQKWLREGLEPLLSAGRIPVLQGFIGATRSGITTTIGRGGSDYSAAIVGGALGAEEIQIWTDVDGVMTTDPRIVPDARPIETLSFAEAAELAYFGARVLHPSTLRPAMTRNIPVRVLNSRNPENEGTTIVRHTPPPADLVRAIAMKRGITVVNVASDRMLLAHGFLARLFEVFSRHETSIDMVTTSEVSVSMTLDDTRRLEGILAELSTLGEISVDRDQAIVCLVGDGLKSEPGLVARVFSAVRALPVSMISHGASAINISFVVPGSAAEAAVTALHADFFSTSGTRVTI